MSLLSRNTGFGSTCLTYTGRGYFYVLTASHFGTQPPSAGTQPRQIFDHCVPKEKEDGLPCHSCFFYTMSYLTQFPAQFPILSFVLFRSPTGPAVDHACLPACVRACVGACAPACLPACLPNPAQHSASQQAHYSPALILPCPAAAPALPLPKPLPYIAANMLLSCPCRTMPCLALPYVALLCSAFPCPAMP